MTIPCRFPRSALLPVLIVFMGLSVGAARARSPAGQPQVGRPQVGQPLATGQPPSGEPQATGKPARRVTLAEHFAAANTTHDGHLTLEQARAGLPMAARHFQAMDKADKGYVTLDDIHAYLKAQRASRHQVPAGGPVNG